MAERETVQDANKLYQKLLAEKQIMSPLIGHPNNL